MKGPPPSLAARVRGALGGAAAAAPPGPRALALSLAEELLEGRFDFRRLADRWVAAGDQAPEGLGAWTRGALDHLRTRAAPPPAAAGPLDTGPVLWLVPIALRTFTTPVNLVSGTYHTARLTHPDEAVAWAAVAVNVGIGWFLSGRRDFLADTVAVLRNNEAPAGLMDAVRAIPRIVRAEDLDPAGGDDDPVAVAQRALWLAHHEPIAWRGLEGLVERRLPFTAAVAAALLGARDGERTAEPPDAPRWDRLAERLAGLPGGG